MRRWLPPLFWAGVILIATSLPASLVPPQASAYDKVLHFTVYALFGVLLTRELAQTRKPWRAALAAIVIAAAFGAADEWHQQFIPGRSTEMADWRADSMGAALGAVLFVGFSRMRQPKTPTAT